MDSFAIGISGLTASQRALDVVGNNIANAATDGYHRQRVDLVPAAVNVVDGNVFGGGVDIANVSRVYDRLLEQEIIRQQSSDEQVSRVLDSLKTVESALGDISAGGLDASIDTFFDSLQDLSLHPTNDIYLDQTVNTAQSMTRTFNSIGGFFDNLESQVTNEANMYIDQVNQLVSKIAQLNGMIEDIEIRGNQASNLRDARDISITDLSKLIGIQTIERENGITDVSFNGMNLITSRMYVTLDAKLQSDGKIGVATTGNDNYDTDIQGGKLGGLFALRNELLPQMHDQIDNLALNVIQQINAQHVQGVGSGGSFSELTGWEMLNQDLSSFVPPVTDGKITMRVIDQNTGEVTRHTVDVLQSDSLADIAAKFDALDGMNASVASGTLHLQAQDGYKFDFLPGVLSSPTTSTLTGTAVPNIAGTYTGTSDQTYTITVQGTGRVGVDQNIAIKIENQAGELVRTVNVGQGYLAGDKIQIGDGISVAFSAGTVTDGQALTVEAIANSDTSGFLAAAGINTFFSGQNATTISISDRLEQDPALIATAVGPDLNDSINVKWMAELAQKRVTALNNKTASDCFRGVVTQLGQNIKISEMQHDSLTGLLQNLEAQQESASGVNINDEAAQLLVYERMFQAVGKYMQTVKGTLDIMMEMVG